MAVECTDRPVVTDSPTKEQIGGSKEDMLGQKTLSISECLILSAVGKVTEG